MTKITEQVIRKDWLSQDSARLPRRALY